MQIVLAPLTRESKEIRGDFCGQLIGQLYIYLDHAWMSNYDRIYSLLHSKDITFDFKRTCIIGYQ